MSALTSAVAAAAAAACAKPLAAAYERWRNAREPRDRKNLRAPTESKVLYSLAAALLLFASLGAEGAWRAASAITFPLAGLFAFLARGAHRMRLRILQDGFEFTGLVAAPKILRWSEIDSVEPDGPWWVFYSKRCGRVLVSRSLLGMKYFASALTQNLAAERLSAAVRKQCKALHDRAA